MYVFPVNPQLVPTAPVNRQAHMVHLPSTSQQSLLMHQPPYPMVREGVYVCACVHMTSVTEKAYTISLSPTPQLVPTAPRQTGWLPRPSTQPPLPPSIMMPMGTPQQISSYQSLPPSLTAAPPQFQVNPSFTANTQYARMPLQNYVGLPPTMGPIGLGAAPSGMGGGGVGEGASKSSKKCKKKMKKINPAAIRPNMGEIQSAKAAVMQQQQQPAVSNYARIQRGMGGAGGGGGGSGVDPSTMQGGLDSRWVGGGRGQSNPSVRVPCQYYHQTSIYMNYYARQMHKPKASDFQRKN